MAQQKNIVQGNISNVKGDVRIGDDIHHHYNAVKLSKELTLHIPKVHPDDIIGREQDMEQLHTLLNAQKRVVVVNGMGGIGKTTLIQAYIHQYYDHYQHIAWITQSSDSILNDVVNTAGLLKTLGVDTTDAKPEELLNQIILKLKNIPEQPNLLIIDNGEQSLAKYRDILPGQPNWHLLVTSRETIAGFYQQDLGFLSEAESIALFKKHYYLNYLSNEEIKELVTLVDYHTLTIEILAKMAVVQRYDVQKLKKAIEDDLRANIQVAHNHQLSKIDRVTSYLKTVFTFTRVTENEQWLLKQLAALPAEFHTYELLRDLLIDEKGGYAGFFTESLHDLVQKGWILQNKATDNFKMHRIIAEIVKLQLSPHSTEMAFLLSTITNKLDFKPTDNPADSFRWIPFGFALLECLANETAPTIAELQNNLAITLKNQGNYSAAKDLLLKAIEADENSYGPNHPITAIRNSNLATVLLDLGKYEDAKIYMEKAVLADEKNFGPEHPTTARRYSNLAMILQDLKDYAGAKLLMEKAVASDENTFGPEHPTVARRYSNLALILKDLGETEQAKLLMKKALESDLKNFGENHIIVARRWANLGAILQDLEDYEGAESLMRKSLELTEQIYGSQHPNVASSCANLANLLSILNRFPEAIESFKKALHIYSKWVPEDHPRYKQVYASYMSVIKLSGNK